MTLVEAYEEEHYAIETPDPIEAIKFRMEQGASAAALWSRQSAATAVCRKSSIAGAR